MKKLTANQLQELKGGITNSTAMGVACGLTIVAGLLCGFGGGIFAAVVGPSVCGTGIGLAIVGQ